MLDGSNKDLEAKTLLEYLLDANSQERNVMKHCISFTQACMVKHAVDSEKRSPDKNWAATKFAELVPVTPGATPI